MPPYLPPSAQNKGRNDQVYTPPDKRHGKSEDRLERPYLKALKQSATFLQLGSLHLSMLIS